MHPKYFQNYNDKEVNSKSKRIDEMRELYQQYLEQTEIRKIYLSILNRMRSEIKAGYTSVRVFNNYENNNIYTNIIKLLVEDGFTVLKYDKYFDVGGWA